MIPTRIRDLREDRDIKQITIATCLCIKQSTYSDYENEVINIPIEAFVKLSEYYNTSIDYLVKKTDCTESYPKSKTIL